MTRDQQVVLSMLDDVEPMTIDELCLEIPMGEMQVTTAIRELERKGVVKHHPGCVPVGYLVNKR